MSTPPGDPHDPNQPQGEGGYGQQPPPPPGGYGQQPPYGQQPADPYAQYPPPYAPPVQGGYGQQQENHPKATTALVLGIVGTLLLVISIVALIFVVAVGSFTFDVNTNS